MLFVTNSVQLIQRIPYLASNRNENQEYFLGG